MHADDRTGNPTVPPTGGLGRTTRPPTSATNPEVDNTSLIVGVAATVIAGAFVLLACLALFITILIKFGRRRRPAQHSGRPCTHGTDDTVAVAVQFHQL